MFEKIIDKIEKAESIAIFSHENPDGDALGSSYSLKNVLKNMGKRADVFVSGNIEKAVKELVVDFDDGCLEIKDYDLLIALDCADAKRLGEFSDSFLNHQNTAAIDHHITHIKYSDVSVVYDISSNCELIYKLYKEMGVSLSLEAATAVYVGMVTDTGNFKYSSVTAQTHKTAAELIECGVDFSYITKRLFDTMSKAYLALNKTALEKIEYMLDDKIAVLTLTNEDFENAGIEEADASSIVTLPSKIEGVLVGAYYRHRGKHGYKVSLRSSNNIDVSKIAAYFGGGGHIRAAGYSIEEFELAENKLKLLKLVKEQI